MDSIYYQTFNEQLDAEHPSGCLLYSGSFWIHKNSFWDAVWSLIAGHFIILAEFCMNIISDWIWENPASTHCVCGSQFFSNPVTYFSKGNLMDSRAPLYSKALLFIIALANAGVIARYCGYYGWFQQPNLSLLTNKVRTTSSYVNTPKLKVKL